VLALRIVRLNNTAPVLAPGYILHALTPPGAFARRVIGLRGGFCFIPIHQTRMKKQNSSARL
jgi:hypothetical protein